MKRVFKYYCIIWATLVALFNVISFVSVGWAGIEKYTPSFWIGYVLITHSFVGQIVCTYFALKNSDFQKTFYNIPLIKTSYIGLFVSFIFGGMCMILSSLLYWIGILMCTIVLAFNIIALIKASAAIEIISSIDEKANTFFIKSLTTDAESLVARAKSEIVKANCQKVYEAIRFSDPVSNDTLASIESDITVMFAKLSELVAENEVQHVEDTVNELVALLSDRNKKCRLTR